MKIPNCTRQNLEQQETVLENTGSEEAGKGQSYSLEEEMAPHSSTLAWKIPWMEKPGGFLSMGLPRVGHD